MFPASLMQASSAAATTFNQRVALEKRSEKMTMPDFKGNLLCIFLLFLFFSFLKEHLVKFTMFKLQKLLERLRLNVDYTLDMEQLINIFLS